VSFQFKQNRNRAAMRWRGGLGVPSFLPLRLPPARRRNANSVAPALREGVTNIVVVPFVTHEGVLC
jgi:hypothetical protein